MSMNDHYASRSVPEHINYALKELNEAVAAVTSACERATKLSDDFYPVKDLLPYTPLQEALRTRTEYRIEASLEAAYKACLPIREQNLAIIAENRALKEKLHALFMKLEVPTKRVNMNTSRSWNAKAKWQETGWPNSLDAIPLTDGWTELERQYHDTLKAMAEAKKKKALEQEHEQYLRGQEEKKRRDTVALGVLAEKLGLDVMSDKYDIRRALLEKNKYLRLADAMYRTRCDWSDGPYRVSDALSGFVVETEEDRDIREKLSGYTNEWDSDGRVFRDCEYNYTVLFEKVQASDPDLWAMYEKFREIEGETD